MLKTVSKFDFIERNKGFFKFQQENLHKSNIYSVKLINTRLNPEFDRKVQYFKSQSELNNYLIKNHIQFKYNNIMYTIDAFENDQFKCNETLFDKDEIYNILTYKFIYNELNQLIHIYNISEKTEIDKENIIKNRLRGILQTAIRKSVAEYMPADTSLWKIIYTGV